ncbi:MAG: hypothetical protein JOZ37_19100 [Actinobacteria bacterium]|nr:hypothetical protein [Actinomycetota bacterium]
MLASSSHKCRSASRIVDHAGGLGQSPIANGLQGFLVLGFEPRQLGLSVKQKGVEIHAPLCRGRSVGGGLDSAAHHLDLGPEPVLLLG